MSANPFKPTAGKMPPILIGRDDVISDFAQGIENGAGAPSRLMLVTGQRGSGKTVLLTELGRVALSYAWDVVSETASQGLVERLIGSLRRGRARLVGAVVEPRITVGSASLSVGSMEFSRSEAALTLRTAIEERLSQLPPGKGILFTVDEVQAAAHDDLVAIATAVQHVIRDEDLTDMPDDQKHGIAFVFAGMSSVIDDLVNDEVLTFLRRCVRHDLGDVPIPDVKNAYIATVTESGKRLAATDAMRAAKASDGFPYMIQLVGYYMWQAAQVRRSDEISGADIASGVSDATLAFGESVCAPAYRSLTAAQQEFVRAMADDWPEASEMSDIARRAGKSRSWASKYRASLIRENVIVPAGRGRVAFGIPHLGEYLQNT